jgi:hypothetical protein
MPAIGSAQVDVTVDARRMHAYATLVEKHAAAFRADLEKLMARDSTPATGDQHTVTLGTYAVDLTHPAACLDQDACPYTAAAAAMTLNMLAIGGTWTCGLHGGELIILERTAM